jgi:small subunit ribosomal protein S21
MLIVKVKEGESIEKALKHFKRKFNLTGAIKELRDREQFTKPSVKRRETKKKAIYVQKLRTEEEKNF